MERDLKRIEDLFREDTYEFEVWKQTKMDRSAVENSGNENKGSDKESKEEVLKGNNEGDGGSGYKEVSNVIGKEGNGRVIERDDKISFITFLLPPTSSIFCIMV